MKLLMSCLLLVSVATTLAIPVELGEVDDQSGSRTWDAIKNFFQPAVNWFRDDLPEKTPSDIAKDVSDSVTDVKEWSDESAIIQSAKEAIRPLIQWFRDTAQTLKDKTFREMFQDAKNTATKVDQSVGDWIDDKFVPEDLH